MFHQVEGLASFMKSPANLKGTLTFFIHQFFSPNANAFSTQFFPFTGPTPVDIYAISARGKDASH
jgi:phenylalanyl-tRNA synthetase alpha subunit